MVVQERPTVIVAKVVTDRVPVIRARRTPADARRLVPITVAIARTGAGLDAAVRALPGPVPARRDARDGWAAGAGQGARDGHSHDCPPLAASPCRCRPALDRSGGAPLRHRHHPDARRGTPPHGWKRRAGPNASPDRSSGVGGRDERGRRDGITRPVQPMQGQCVGSPRRHGSGTAPPADAPAPDAAAVVARPDHRRDRVRGGAAADAVIR